uniref:PIN domain-containing protein n=1 Tax=Chlorobium chlorochromatii (strain CaD3) TaxID=340177 RepID=Q3ASA3_CHLCH
MSGIKYLLDTNIILGLLKATSTVLEAIGFRSIQAAECGYSAITRISNCYVLFVS